MLLYFLVDKRPIFVVHYSWGAMTFDELTELVHVIGAKLPELRKMRQRLRSHHLRLSDVLQFGHVDHAEVLGREQMLVTYHILGFDKWRGLELRQINSIHIHL